MAAGPVVDKHRQVSRYRWPRLSTTLAGNRAQAAWAQLSRQYGTLQCEKGVWLMLQLYGAASCWVCM